MVFCSSARFAKKDRVFALFYVSLGFVNFPKRAKGGPFLGPSVLQAASTLGQLLLGSAAERQRRPAVLRFCAELSQRVQQANAEAKHQRVRAAEAQPQSPS